MKNMYNERTLLPNVSRTIADPYPKAPGIIKMLLEDEYRADVIYIDVLCNLIGRDPVTYQEAMSCGDAPKWRQAIEIDYDNLRRRNVLREVAPPVGRNVNAIGSKLGFKSKYKNGKIDKYKVRLVARGFTQVQYDDYN